MDYVSSSVNSVEQMTELYVKKVLLGNLETVRKQIINSMESLDYDIIEEEPTIIGRRSEKGWGVWLSSADILDYPMTLTVRLKAVGENSTQATFDYLIKHPMLTKSDKAVVVQEAKTIAAISKVQSIEKMCAVCETESTDDSKFCRRCGAPLTSEQVEREILRMTAETSAGLTSVASTTITTAISIIFILLAIILSLVKTLDTKPLIILLGFGGITALLSLIFSLFGWNRLKRALYSPTKEPQTNFAQSPKSLETGEFQELPTPWKPVASITEGTTNLLDKDWANVREKEKVPIGKRRETNELE